MNAQERFWNGKFGDDYTIRNRVDWSARAGFWKLVLDKTSPESVIEAGCNAGWNLMAITKLRPQVVVGGIDINGEAVLQARAYGVNAIEGSLFHINHFFPGADLVFTSGVLIHIAPENLRESMQKLTMATRRYVLAIEYESDVEQEIEYRGERERLWKRPFGKLYEELGLSPAGYWPNVEGWDRCAAWLMEKR